METTWKITSGGRLKNYHLPEKTFFVLSTDRSFDNILFADHSIKKSFEENLRSKLISRGLYTAPAANFVWEYKARSIDTIFPDEGRQFELAITLMHIKTNSLFWYFILTSPEESINPNCIPEIIDHLLERLPIKCSKACSEKI